LSLATQFIFCIIGSVNHNLRHAQMHNDDLNKLPDIRDGLTRKERIVLYCIHEIQKERGGRNVPTVMLYGRVVEQVNISEQELQLILQRLTNYNQTPGSAA